MARWEDWLLNNSNPTFTAYDYWDSMKIEVDNAITRARITIKIPLGPCTDNYPYPNKDATICYNNSDFAVHDIAKSEEGELRRFIHMPIPGLPPTGAKPGRGGCKDWCYVTDDPGCKDNSTVKTLKCSDDSKVAQACKKLTGYNYQGNSENNRTICYNNEFCARYPHFPPPPENLQRRGDNPVGNALFPWREFLRPIINNAEVIGRFCGDVLYGLPEDLHVDPAKRTRPPFSTYHNNLITEKCEEWANKGWDVADKTVQNTLNHIYHTDPKVIPHCDCDDWCYTEKTPRYQHTCIDDTDTGKVKNAYSCKKFETIDPTKPHPRNPGHKGKQ